MNDEKTGVKKESCVGIQTIFPFKPSLKCIINFLLWERAKIFFKRAAAKLHRSSRMKDMKLCYEKGTRTTVVFLHRLKVYLRNNLSLHQYSGGRIISTLWLINSGLIMRRILISVNNKSLSGDLLSGVHCISSALLSLKVSQSGMNSCICTLHDVVYVLKRPVCIQDIHTFIAFRLVSFYNIDGNLNVCFEDGRRRKRSKKLQSEIWLLPPLFRLNVSAKLCYGTIFCAISVI